MYLLTNKTLCSAVTSISNITWFSYFLQILLSVAIRKMKTKWEKMSELMNNNNE